MKYLIYLTVSVAMISMSFSCQSQKSAETTAAADPYHVVFVIGDEEYRSEESMPMIAKILKRELGCEITLCYSVDSTGTIDPNRSDHIAGLEALEDADLMVMFTRFRRLPQEELQYILDYAESGRPMVGFRTSTHAFNYPKEDSLLAAQMNAVWPTKVFGQQWITHHGHFEDGHGRLTRVDRAIHPEHPIMSGVESFDAYSWLYHVDGGEWLLHGDSEPLLTGTSMRSNHEEAGRLAQYSLTNPVAWTKSYTGSSGKKARVFFTTLGHPYDFHLQSMRKLALNGIYWALGEEDQIPADGINVDFAAPYDPNNSGFGQKYKPGLKPEEI